MADVIMHGVYKVRAPQPCYIVELTIKNSQQKLNFAEVLFDVEIPGYGMRTQAPFNEHFISLDGEKVLGDYKVGWKNPGIWKGDVRLAFLMHYLEPGKFLRTPYGDVEIPKITTRPGRLKKIKYVSPY